MDKISINITAPKKVKIQFQDNDIIIDPILSFGTRLNLIKSYADILFSDKDDFTQKYLEAEYVVVYGVLDYNTNIDIQNIKIDQISGKGGLWEQVKTQISNYDEFEKEIETVVKGMREEKSIGVSFDRIATQVSFFIDKISQIDISKEGLANLLNTLDKEKNEINKIVDPSKVKPSSVGTKIKRKSSKDIIL